MNSEIQLSISDLGQILVALTAIAGLVISIINLISRTNEKRPKLKLSISHGGYITHNNNMSEFMILIKIANFGIIPINISSIYGIIEGNTILLHNIEGTATLPFSLEPRKSHNFWFPYRKFLTYLKSEGYKGKLKMDFIVSDEIGNKYRKTEKFEIS